ncbi:hypothetical protein P3W45_000708 [Vairimorpha bombi]
MDFYLDNLHNFINTFRNNLHNEYNKNKILSNKISGYKRIYDDNCIKKMLVHTDKVILKGIDNLYNEYIKNKYNTKLSTEKNNTKLFTDEIPYVNLYLKHNSNKFFIEDNLIKDLSNPKNYTEEGLADYYLVNGIQNILDIRRIENTKDLMFEFEVTVLDKEKVNNKICKIKVEKNDEIFKIDQINCVDL